MADLPIDTKDPSQRRELGRRLHERSDWPSVELAAEALGVHKSLLYQMQREYREASGIEISAGGRRRLTDAQRRDRDAERHALKRAEQREAKIRAHNGNGNGHMVVVPPAYDTAPLLARIQELEEHADQLEHERTVLQKLLMAVGERL